VLTLDRLTYRHAGATRPALRAIDLIVRDGEVLGVVGPNESGKSTLCLVASGLAPRVVGGTLEGRVLIDGTDVAGLATHALPAMVGIVFGDPDSQLSGVTLTVYEEVAFGPSNLGLPAGEVVARTERALEALDISSLAARDPARLSGGQRQLVAIASVLAMEPRHIVLDEPTAQLDPAGTELMGRAIQALAARGASVLLVEHKTDLLAAVCTRVVALRAGAIVLDDPADTALSDPGLLELGVPEPSLVRLRRLAAEQGVDLDRWLRETAT
jgi:energy-coupling factor transport system ATP-binding protein